MPKSFVHATLKVRHGKLEEFVEAYGPQVPILESLGWKLIGGWTDVFGRVYNVINVWEIPDINTFMETVQSWRESPEGQAFRAVSAEVVEEEIVHLMKGVSYCP